MADLSVTTSSVAQSNIVLVDYVKRETTQRPKRYDERPYRPNVFQGYTDSWYSEDENIPDLGDDSDNTDDSDQESLFV